MPHPALSPDHTAVITGGASGIGLAAAMRLAGLGMKVCIADVDDKRLEQAATRLSSIAEHGAASVMTANVDVSRRESVVELEEAVRTRFGGTDLLLNNAGIQPGSKMFGPLDNWQRILGVNLWGIINGSQVFAPGMIARGKPALIINTGSKQGITTPPGDPAYNVSKAGVKGLYRGSAARTAQHARLPGVGASVHSGLRVHAADRQRPHREAGCRLDAGTDGRFHAGACQRRRLLHPLSR